MKFKIANKPTKETPNNWTVEARVRGKKSVLSEVTFRQVCSFLKALGFDL